MTEQRPDDADRSGRPGRGWHRGWFPVPFFPLVLTLVVVAWATHTWWVLLGIPLLWLLAAPLRRRAWARRWARHGYC